MQRYIITITGKVQGVFFRDSARRVATELGLTGFVRNEPDGSVYIEIEGNEPALTEFLKWCSAGPEYAQVENVEYAEHGVVGYRGFKVA